MRKFAKKLIGIIIGEKANLAISRLISSPKRQVMRYCNYDAERFAKYSGVFQDSQGAALAKIIALYHVLEKGLTMPNRRLGFGQKVALDLMRRVDIFETNFGKSDEQVNHAVGVIKAYWELHKDIEEGEDRLLNECRHELLDFVDAHPNIKTATQPHVTKEKFFSLKESSFPIFASARHTLRHYAPKTVPLSKIATAVELARTTPSACNRQYCRVYCISDKQRIEALLKLQAGSRGFGNLADKLLIVTADLEGIIGIAERNDAFVNGGMFLMNLCYALYYNELAHCVLNWSRSPETDVSMRKIISIKPSEVVVALITCGEAPDEFDVAESPRKPVSDFLVVI